MDVDTGSVVYELHQLIGHLECKFGGVLKCLFPSPLLSQFPVYRPSYPISIIPEAYSEDPQEL